MQTALAEAQTTLDAIAQGDPESLSADQAQGIIRMVPAVLNHLAEADAETYTATMLPHFVEALRSSELVQNFNGLVNALQEQPPAWLRPEQKSDWINERLNRVLSHASNMGQWFKAQEERSKELQKNPPKGSFDSPQEKPAQAGEVANPQVWKDNIYPETNSHAEAVFEKELRPWAEKLAKAGFRLSNDKKMALAQELVRGVTQEAMKNPDYKAQIGRYNRQRNPDSASVISTFKGEFNKHAPRVLEALIRRDYGQVLDKRTAPKTNGTGNSNQHKTAPVVPQKGVKIVSVKPQRSEIDFPRTPSDWLYQNKWRLRDGSVVQYRP